MQYWKIFEFAETIAVLQQVQHGSNTDAKKLGIV